MGPHSTDHFGWTGGALVGGNARWNERGHSRTGAHRGCIFRTPHIRQSPLRRPRRFGIGVANRIVVHHLADADYLGGGASDVGQPALGVRQLVHDPNRAPAVVHQRHTIPFRRPCCASHWTEHRQLGAFGWIGGCANQLAPRHLQGMGHVGHWSRMGRSRGFWFPPLCIKLCRNGTRRYGIAV